ncbi:hypothetical protein WN943_012416 [Citrus x changshan-huyou]
MSKAPSMIKRSFGDGLAKFRWRLAGLEFGGILTVAASILAVKSGYYLAMQIKNMSCAEASTGVSRRCIWELRVPAGVKIFLRCLWDGF